MSDIYKTFEGKLFLISINYVLFFVIFSLITDLIIVGFGIVQKIYSLNLFILFGIRVLRERYSISVLSIPFNFFLTLTISFVFLYSGGIYGIAPYLFLSFSLIITIICPPNQRIFHFLFILLVFFGLMLYEIQFPGNISDSTDPQIKIYEMAVGVFILLNASFAIFYKFITEYEKTKVDVEDLKEKLSHEIELNNKKNIELNRINEIYKNKIINSNQIHDIIIHELKAPINSISEGLLLIDDEVKAALDDEAYQLYRSFEATTKHSTNVIDSLLMINKVESNKLIIKKDRFNLREVVDRELNSITTLAKINRIKITVAIADNLYAIYDKNIFSLIFRNLIYHAIHTSFKDNKIDVSVKVEEEFYECLIRDYGRGLGKNVSYDLFKGINMGAEIPEFINMNYSFKLINNLLKNTNQNFHVQSDLQKGTLVTFTVPKEQISK